VRTRREIIAVQAASRTATSFLDLSSLKRASHTNATRRVSNSPSSDVAPLFIGASVSADPGPRFAAVAALKLRTVVLPNGRSVASASMSDAVAKHCA
jgi:hypothetical protein